MRTARCVFYAMTVQGAQMKPKEVAERVRLFFEAIGEILRVKTILPKLRVKAEELNRFLSGK